MQSFSGKPFPQRQFEIETLRDLMVAKDCLSYLEIGARFGDSFHFLAKALGTGAKALAVDMPGGPWGDKESEPALARAVNDLRENHGIGAGVILGDSRVRATIGAVQDLGPWDAVLIDGDHSIEGVTADWENYGPLARKLVAFHDIDAGIKPAKKAKRYGVPQLWAELKKTRAHVEIICAEREMGIGVLFV